MKRHILLLLLLPLQLFAQTTETKELLPQLSHIVVLGDSNTWLGGDDCSDDKGWTYYFKNELRPASCRSYARSGATWSHTAKTCADTEEDAEVITDNNVLHNQYLRLRRDVLQGKQPRPTLLLIAAGTNDAWFCQKQRKGCLDNPKEADANANANANADNILALDLSELTGLREAVLFNCLTIRRDFPQTRIVLLTPLQSVHAGLRPIALAGDCIEACAKQLGVECFRQDKECCVRNLTEQKERRHTTDGTHLNRTAARLIGQQLAKVLFPQTNTAVGR
ncbi:MAG: SGNH/GDSL hydrolase family protein [Alloprevotella sp.]